MGVRHVQLTGRTFWSQVAKSGGSKPRQKPGRSKPRRSKSQKGAGQMPVLGKWNTKAAATEGQQPTRRRQISRIVCCQACGMTRRGTDVCVLCGGLYFADITLSKCNEGELRDLARALGSALNRIRRDLRSTPAPNGHDSQDSSGHPAAPRPGSAISYSSDITTLRNLVMAINRELISSMKLLEQSKRSADPARSITPRRAAPKQRKATPVRQVDSSERTRRGARSSVTKSAQSAGSIRSAGAERKILAPAGESLVEVNPVAASWWASVNNERPGQVDARLHVLAWWRCPSGSHRRWQAYIDLVAQGQVGCPACAREAGQQKTSARRKAPRSRREPVRQTQPSPYEKAFGVDPLLRKLNPPEAIRDAWR